MGISKFTAFNWLYKYFPEYMRKGEKEQWIAGARRLLQEQGKKGTQREIAKALGMGIDWVKKYDPNRNSQEQSKSVCHTPFFGYNVWGFKDESWRELIVKAYPNQPDVAFYHGDKSRTPKTR